MKMILPKLFIIALTFSCPLLISCSEKEQKDEKLVTPEQKEILDEMSDTYEK